MKTVLAVLLLAMCSLAQQSINLTSGSVLVTVNYSQDATPKITGSIGYLTPLNADTGTSSYSLLNVVPIASRDAKGKLVGYTWQTSVQTGAFQRLAVIGKGKQHELSFGVCGAAGVALAASVANGAASACGIVDVRLGAHLAIIAPIRGQYVAASGWALQPSIGIRYSFKAQ